MRLAHTIALACLAGAASVLPAAARTINVPQQYPTIQAALNAAKPGDTVHVFPKPRGTVYHETLTMRTPNVTLQGKKGAILDGAGLSTMSPPDPPFEPHLIAPDGIDIRADHVAVRDLTIQNFIGDNFADTSAISVGYTLPPADPNDPWPVLQLASNSDIEVSGCTLRNNHRGVFFETYAGVGPAYGGGGASLKGYKILGNLITGNDATGVTVTNYLSNGAEYVYDDSFNVVRINNTDLGLLVSGNKITGNGDGIDTDGDGQTITGNEIANNGYSGVYALASTVDPAPGAARPAPSVVALNAIRDNGGYGVWAYGSLTITGNTVAHNTDCGILLDYADGGLVTLNRVTGTVGDHYPGVGIYVDYSAYGGPLTVAANQVGGNDGAGIYLYEADGVLVTGNAVNGNRGIGIQASDESGYYTGVPNTITYNTARGNTPLDAQDDYTAEGFPSPNHWANNNFGTANIPTN